MRNIIISIALIMSVEDVYSQTTDQGTDFEYDFARAQVGTETYVLDESYHVIGQIKPGEQFLVPISNDLNDNSTIKLLPICWPITGGQKLEYIAPDNVFVQSRFFAKPELAMLRLAIDRMLWTVRTKTRIDANPCLALGSKVTMQSKPEE